MKQLAIFGLVQNVAIYRLRFYYGDHMASVDA